MNPIEKQILLKINKTFESEINKFNSFQGLADVSNVLGGDALMYVAAFNNTGINVTKEEIDYLIKNSNLRNSTKMSGYSALFLFMLGNKSQGLNLTEEQWDYLVRGSDPKQTDAIRKDALSFYIIHKRTEDIKLSESTIDYFIDSYMTGQVADVLEVAVQYEEYELLKKVLEKTNIKTIGDAKKICKNKNVTKKVREIIDIKAVSEKIGNIKTVKTTGIKGGHKI